MRALKNYFTLFIEITRFFQKSKCLQIAEDFSGKIGVEYNVSIG